MSRRLRRNLHTVLELLLSVSDDTLASFESRRDNHRGPLRQIDLDIAHLRVVLGVDHINETAVGPTLYGAGWCGDSVIQLLQQQVRIHELVWPQRVVRVIE